MKFLKILLTFLLIMVNFLPNNYILSQANISSKDLEGLNLSPDDSQDFEQFLDALNNLSPEEQEMLNDLGQQMEKEMADSGLDPSDPDDIFKWVDKQAEQESSKKKTEEPKKPEKTEKQETKETKIEFIAEPKDTLAMLNQIIKHLGRLRQKASTVYEMSISLERYKQELNELTYFLNILTQEDLLKHLSSQDFEKLYKNLAELNKVLITYEPAIEIKDTAEVDISNPYETLELPNSASLQEIEDQFKEFKQAFSQENIKTKLKSKNLSEKELNKRVKQAKISFRFIQDAYDQLKDPKQKAIIDRSLREKVQFNKELKRASQQAFEKIKAVLTKNLFIILEDIGKLLEKYKPEELKKFQAQEELEKKILEESKKPVKVTPTRKQSQVSKDTGYKDFYQHMNKLDMQRQHQRVPIRPYVTPKAPPKPAPKPQPKKSENEKKKQEQAAEKKKLEEKKKKKKLEEEKKKKEEEAKKKAAKDGLDKKADDTKSNQQKRSTQQASQSQVKDSINSIAKILDKAKNKIKVIPARTVFKRQAPTQTKKITVDQIAKDLNQYLSQAVPVSAQAEQAPINHFLEFLKQNSTEQLWKDLTLVSQNLNKITDAEKQIWNNKIQKNSNKIETLKKEFYPILSLKARNQRNLSSNNNKLIMHNLKVDKSKSLDQIRKKLRKLKRKYPNINNVNLSVPKQHIKEIYENFNKISNALK